MLDQFASLKVAAADDDNDTTSRRTIRQPGIFTANKIKSK